MAFQQIVETVSAIGTLGLALLGLYAFLTERIVPKGRLDEANARTAEHKAEKKEAFDLARESIAAQERLAAAVEARNELERERR